MKSPQRRATFKSFGQRIAKCVQLCNVRQPFDWIGFDWIVIAVVIEGGTSWRIGHKPHVAATQLFWVKMPWAKCGKSTETFVNR